MSPLAGSRVIPAGWSEHHRPVAEGSMTATCDVLLPGERTGYAEPAPVVVAEGVPCRVQQYAGRAKDQGVAGREAYTRDYLITLPVAAAGALRAGSTGHMLRMTSTVDPHLNGRTLRIRQVLYGSEVWERDVIAVDDLTLNQGVAGEG